MSAQEFMRWQQFYLQSPFDDMHRYHRPAAWVSAHMSGAKITDSLEFLINNLTKSQADAGGLSEVDLSILNLLGK